MTVLGYALTVLSLLNSSKGCLILLKSSDKVSYSWETIYANEFRIYEYLPLKYFNSF